MICPSCVGGETSDFGGIQVDPCLSEARELATEERDSTALRGLEAAFELPLHAAFRWAVPSASEPDAVRDTEVAIGVAIDTESAVYLERSPVDPLQTASSECPDQFLVNATVDVALDDASLAAQFPASVTSIATGGLWELSGFHDLAGVRGELDLKLNARQTYIGLLQFAETGDESGRCGTLRLMTKLRGEHVWVTRAEGTWRSGSCPN